MEKYLKIYYYAYQQEPFNCDGIGYALPEKLINGDNEKYFIWNEEDLPIANEGYSFVYENNNASGDYWIIANDDIYTEAIPNSALSGGYGMPYPSGGLTACSGYDIEGLINDEYEGEIHILLKNYVF